MAANSSRSAPAASRNRIVLLIGILAVTGIVALSLPKSWYEVPPPTRPSVGKPGPEAAGESPSGSVGAPSDSAERLAALRLDAQNKPLDVGARSRYGMALVASGHSTEALPEFEAAERLGPTVPAVHHNLGVYYLNAGRFAAAEAQFCRELELSPADGRAHYYRGLIFQRRKEGDPAAAEFREAIALAPQMPDAYLSLALELTRTHDAAQMLALTDRYVQLGGDKALADYVLSGAYKSWKKYPEAARYAESSVKLKPDDYGYWHNLGQIYSYDRRWDDAERALERARTLAHDPSTALIELGMNAQRAGRFEAAERDLRDALAANPKLGDVHLYLTRLYRHWGKESQATEEEKLFRAWEKEAQVSRVKQARENQPPSGEEHAGLRNP